MRQRRVPEEESNPSTAGDGSSALSAHEGEFDVSTFLFSAGVGFVKQYKKLTGAYLIGLIVLIFATGISVSQEDIDSYSKVMTELDKGSPLMFQYNTAYEKYLEFSAEYEKNKGWIFCDSVCVFHLNKRRYAEKQLNDVKRKINAVKTRAKSHLGVFSEHSVQETRDLFWGMFGSGKDFAQRSSWWDLLFMGIDSIGNDEHIAAFLIRFIFQLVINFTLGMIGTFIGFVWSLGEVVSSYNPGSIAGWVFYILAILGGFSTVTTFLLVLYFSAAGSVYVAAKTAGPQLLMGGQQRRRVNYRRF